MPASNTSRGFIGTRIDINNRQYLGGFLSVGSEFFISSAELLRVSATRRKVA